MMKGNNPRLRKISGVAIPVISLASGGTANTDATSKTIAFPWRKGRKLAFFFLVQATLNAASALSAKVQAQKKSDSTWVDVLDKDGNPLAFPAAKINDGGTYEGGCAYGSVDLGRFDGATYKALRLRAAQADTNASIIGAAFEILDLYQSKNADGIDELESLQA